MRRILASGLLLGLVLLAAFPLLAQAAATPAPGSAVAAVGPVTITDDEIRVNGYIIAPAGAFRASILDDGDVVIVTGVLLRDGRTIRADMIEFFDEADALNEERTQGDDPGSSQGNHGQGNQGRGNNGRGELNDRAEDEAAADCERDDHPLGERLAATFDVPYAEIMGWRCEHFGFGEIIRAYTLALLTDDPVEAYFALKASGVGWDAIVREAEAAVEDVPVPVVIPGRPLEFCRAGSCSAPGHND